MRAWWRQRSTRARRALAIGLCCAPLALLPSVTASAKGPADDFNPSFIMSDSVLYNAKSMSLDQIAKFINTQGAKCKAAPGNICLKDYRETTTTRLGTKYCPMTYSGMPNESAAMIVYKVSKVCGINPQVLLVMLQKEQTLITQSNNAGRPKLSYERALGAACPDHPTADDPICDASQRGFANQVYSAAARFKQYAAEPQRFAFQAGKSATIRYHKDEARCGSSQVWIKNQATASLYNYTPFQPNAAALAAGIGQGDSCSSYGNRNFFVYFKQWFGDPRK